MAWISGCFHENVRQKEHQALYSNTVQVISSILSQTEHFRDGSRVLVGVIERIDPKGTFAALRTRQRAKHPTLTHRDRPFPDCSAPLRAVVRRVRET